MKSAQKQVESFRNELSMQEQKIKGQVYQQQHYEYAELKRHAEKIRKFAEEANEMKRLYRELSQMTTSYHNN